MKKTLVILSSILFVLAFCTPKTHAFTYMIKGGSLKINPESIDKNNLVVELIELRKAYKETGDPEIKELIDKWAAKQRALIVKESKIKEGPEQKEKSPEIVSATYYSVEDNGRKMANGEIFHNSKIIVAHTEIPVGTKIKIKSVATGNEFITTIQDNKLGINPNHPLVLSKTALVEKLFNGDWDVLYKIKEDGTKIEIIPLEQETPEDQKTVEENHVPEVVEIKKPQPSELMLVRKEIAKLKKEYEETGDEKIKKSLEKLQDKNKRLMQIQRNNLKTSLVEFAAFQKGYATYYSYRFNGRKTANGEIFSNEELTAAHRTLPFNTMVRVVNPETGFEVTVRINDRGPYGKAGRIIDLSKEAFARLYGGDWAHLSHGVTPVELYLLED